MCSNSATGDEHVGVLGVEAEGVDWIWGSHDELRVDGVFEVPDENVRGTNFPVLGYLIFERHPLSAGYRDHTPVVRHPVNINVYMYIYNEHIYIHNESM